MLIIPGKQNEMDELSLPAQIPVDDDYGDTREADIEDTDSALSIASSKYNFRWEHGRLYHDYRSSGAVFPTDLLSRKNEEVFHSMMLCILNNKHFVAPVNGHDLRNILDLGSGLGLWCTNVGDDLPQCKVIGMDYTPMPDSGPYSNFDFELHDIRDEWILTCQPNGNFDLVHIRNMFASLSKSEWPDLYRQCFNSMTSGAWIEQIEFEVGVHCDDGTIMPESVVVRLSELIKDMEKAVDRNFHVAEHMAASIGEAGFVDVQERIFKIPLGSWSADQRYKDIGALFEVFYRTGLQGWTMAALTRGLGWTVEAVNDACFRAFEELDSRQHHYYWELHIVIGRKP